MKEDISNFFALLIATVIVILILIAGWLLIFDDKPSKAAREWLISVNTLDALKADRLTCQVKRKEFREKLKNDPSFVLFGETNGSNGEIELDVSKVKFNTTDSYNNQAFVSVYGDIYGGRGRDVRNRFLKEYWLMQIEDGEWRWCGTSEVFLFPNPYQLTQTKSNEPKPTPTRIGESSGETLSLNNEFGTIAFEYQGKLYITNQGSPGATQISSVGNILGFTWSTDGQKLAASSTEKSYITNIVNSETIEFPHDDYRLGRMNWSPNGSEIAFLSIDVKNQESSFLYVMDSNAFEAKNITPPGETVRNFKWLPNSDKIVYTTGKNIYISNSDGSELFQITHYEKKNNIGNFEFSPDNEKITVYSTKGILFGLLGYTDEIYVYSLDGTLIQTITETDFGNYIKKSRYNYVAYHNWFPNSKQISIVYGEVDSQDGEKVTLIVDIESGKVDLFLEDQEIGIVVELPTKYKWVQESLNEADYIVYRLFRTPKEEGPGLYAMNYRNEYVFLGPFSAFFDPSCHISPDGKYGIVLNYETEIHQIVDMSGKPKSVYINNLVGMEGVYSLCFSPK